MSPEEQIDTIVMATFNALAPEVVADIQSEIGVAFPPPSTPGTPPHLRTGELQGGVFFSVDQFGSEYVLTITSTAPYSEHLEHGTSRMVARPFMLPALDKWGPIITGRLQSAFSGGAGSGAAPPVNTAYGMISPTATAA